MPVQLPFTRVLPFPSPEPQPPRDLDLEVFCDSLEQLEPELVRPSLFSPVPPGSELPHLHPETCDSAQQACAEQRGAAGPELDTGGNPEPPSEKGELSVLPMVPVPQAFPVLIS